MENENAKGFRLRGVANRLLAGLLVWFATTPDIGASDSAPATDATATQSSGAALDRARTSREDGKIDDAVAAYQQSVNLDATQVDAWLELILLLTEISRHRDALEMSELAVQKAAR